MHHSCQVIEPYQAAYPDPFSAPKGERLKFERRDSEWEGWIWCTNDSGQSGWVPETWVMLEGESCVLERDYTGAELSVDRGETISAEFVESGWAWATKENGESGWVPLDNLAPLEYPLTDAEQAGMLRRLMLYWDGQWFLKTVEAFGLEAAIELNARVRTSFGRIEMRLLLKTLHKTQADDLADAMRLLKTYADTFMGKGIRAEFTALTPSQAEIIVRRCAAYEGAKLAALPRTDQACVACETLWNAWLDTVLPGHQVEVQYPERQGSGDPICRFIIHMDAHAQEE
jgi:hypothetical protein